MEKTMNLPEKIVMLRNILAKINEGEDIENIKNRFKNLLKQVKPWEIPIIEQELVKLGHDPRIIARLCEAHVEIFKDTLLRHPDLSPPKGHPLWILLEENFEAVKDVEKLNLLVQGLNENNYLKILSEIKSLITKIYAFKKHFMRIQMQVFPYLERIGLTAVPRVLWRKQDEVIIKLRKVQLQMKKLEGNISADNIAELKRVTADFVKSLMDEVFRENKILFPTIYVLFQEGVWAAIREEEHIIGYYKDFDVKDWKSNANPIYPYDFTLTITEELIGKLPKEIAKMLSNIRPDRTPIKDDNDIAMGNGYLSKEEIKGIFDALPVDITFIDKYDRTKFFSHGGKRIFPRTKSILGRPVDFCHPPRSVHIVKRILRAFKKGERESADFWIKMGNRMIYIRYFPVRDEKGNYLGTLEVVQDITEIKKLEGEKRILDWK